jgi:hypothetical protein
MMAMLYLVLAWLFVGKFAVNMRNCRRSRPHILLALNCPPL